MAGRLRVGPRGETSVAMARLDSEVFRASRSHACFPNRRGVMPWEQSERRAAKHLHLTGMAGSPPELPAAAVAGSSAEPGTRAAAAPLTFDLGGQLSFGLRDFLLDRFGSMLAIDGDRIWLKSGCDLRALASAIRQFSYQHALRRCVRMTAVIDELCKRVASADRVIACPVGLCLQCGTLGVGAGTAGNHSGASCLNVLLGSVPPLPGGGVDGHALVRTLRSGVERFRSDRRSSGHSHFELDCYVSGALLVFTWEPPVSFAAETGS